MFDADFIQMLKRSNISVDPEKTTQRAKELWKTAPSKAKRKIEEDSGVQRVSIYRIYNTGVISAKLAVAFAQNLNIDPAYLTGESDEQGVCNDEVLDRFLRSKGYGQLIDIRARVAQAKRDKMLKKDDAPNVTPGFEKQLGHVRPSFVSPRILQPTVRPETAYTLQDASSTKSEQLSYEDAVALLQALEIRARNSSEAQRQLNAIKKLLLS